MELTAANVEAIIVDCLYKDSELDRDGKPKIEPVVVECIINSYAFHPGRLQEHKREVASMLLQLPKEFFLAGGGGWSFLQMCVRADGVQWTGLHRTQEMLCALAIGLGFASWLVPRNMWEALPGGMPYIQINLNEETSGDGNSTSAHRG